MASAIVLLSSGLDSTVNLFQAARSLDVKKAITFDYGQRAARREIERAQKLCDMLSIEHLVIELPFLRDITKTSLVSSAMEVPTGQNVEIDDLKTSQDTAKKVWVPNRNGIFLNIAAGVAESLGAEYVIPGFNIEEAATFPDNTQDYLSALDNSFSFSTATGVKTKCYTTHLNKTQIVGLALDLEVPLEFVWSCYFGNETMCGECESCKRFGRALRDAGANISAIFNNGVL